MGVLASGVAANEDYFEQFKNIEGARLRPGDEGYHQTRIVEGRQMAVDESGNLVSLDAGDLQNLKWGKDGSEYGRHQQRPSQKYGEAPPAVPQRRLSRELTETTPFDTNVCVKNSERCESISGWGTVSDYPEHGTEQYKESLRFDYTFWEVDKIYMKLELLIEPCMDWIKTGDRGMFTTNQPIVSFFFFLINFNNVLTFASFTFQFCKKL